MSTYRDVTIDTTVDKNLDAMGYKVWIPNAISGSVPSGSLTLSEKYSVHFKTEEEARKYIDYCKDALSSADGTAVYATKLTALAY
jgi:hypothetical protein